MIHIIHRFRGVNDLEHIHTDYSVRDIQISTFTSSDVFWYRNQYLELRPKRARVLDSPAKTKIPWEFSYTELLRTKYQSTRMALDANRGLSYNSRRIPRLARAEICTPRPRKRAKKEARFCHNTCIARQRPGQDNHHAGETKKGDARNCNSKMGIFNVND